ncbi:acyltransferase 3 [Stachybotrys elegans]|uniref:Acyltransferase 3 n=1 Tax=Stachybotrys elegans TaxID=80388 RepID=A0A8K0SLA1_9HYPO|nr:acyltransferase 3 [Stachybotrys elegans]
MLSGLLGGQSARAPDNVMEMLPRTANDAAERGGLQDKAPSSASASPTASRDKVRSLDGLRGIACLLVFNYHFFWPWTPYIMLGYGAFPPRSAEPYTSWTSLPILCLLQRGRPMVAIFFAISGYVLCRHIIRAIRERRIDVAYQKLASSVLRRVFRLYLPPTISMFIVAMLAQMGAFRSEDDVYKGPDSMYINGSVAIVHPRGPCVNGTLVQGGAGIASYLELQSTTYLGNITGWEDKVCLNVTSQLTSPAAVYKTLDAYEKAWINDTNHVQILAPADYLTGDFPAPLDTGKRLNMTNATTLTWVQLGGSWEEHPFIHDNITYALQNFTRSYAEWANPFNFGHYHPRYDPHTFTIPMELRGSMFLYIFLLGTAAIKPQWRLGLGGFLSAYSLTLGRWDMATFMGGALMSELDIAHSMENDRMMTPPSASRSLLQSRRARAGRWAAFVLALYFLSYPDAAAEFTPGFVFLSDWVPRYYIPLSGWMFYQSMGALILLACVLRSPLLCRLLESGPAQYLGKISFSLYLVHGPVLHSLGFWIMPRLFERFGRVSGYAIGYVILMSVTLYLTNLWYRKVDVWSMTVGKRVEKFLLY